jgi:hypothetical protein
LASHPVSDFGPVDLSTAGSGQPVKVNHLARCCVAGQGLGEESAQVVK